MKFILPTGESQSLSVEFIASNLKIEYLKAVDKKCQFEKLLEGKLKTPGEITLVGLVNLIVDNKAKYCTPVWSSYDFPEEVHAAERKIDHCIDELLLLLYKSFPKYFDNETKPSTDALDAYLGTSISYELVDKGGTPLIEKSKWGRDEVELTHLQFSFSVDEDFLKPDNNERKRKSTEIRNKLRKISVASFIEMDGYTKDYPCEFVIPWFFVPILNKNLKKLGYDIAASDKKEKSNSFIPDMKKITSIAPYTYSFSSYSSLFPKTEQNTPERKSYQTILDQFSLLGVFNGYENKLKVSDSLNIIGKTCIEFPSSISFEEIQKIAEKLKSIGLKCEASSLIGLGNSIKISLTVIELEIWLINKVIETQEPKIHSNTPEVQSLLFFGSQEEKSINQNGNNSNTKDDRQNCSTVTQELFLNLRGNNI